MSKQDMASSMDYSDHEEDMEASMFNIMKTGHVPGGSHQATHSGAQQEQDGRVTSPQTPQNGTQQQQQPQQQQESLKSAEGRKASGPQADTEDGGLSSSSSIEYIPEEGGSGTVDQDVPQSKNLGTQSQASAVDDTGSPSTAAAALQDKIRAMSKQDMASSMDYSDHEEDMEASMFNIMKTGHVSGGSHQVTHSGAQQEQDGRVTSPQTPQNGTQQQQQQQQPQQQQESLKSAEGRKASGPQADTEDGVLSSSSSIEYISEEGGSGTVDQDVPQSKNLGTQSQASAVDDTGSPSTAAAALQDKIRAMSKQDMASSMDYSDHEEDMEASMFNIMKTGHVSGGSHQATHSGAQQEQDGRVTSPQTPQNGTQQQQQQQQPQQQQDPLKSAEGRKASGPQADTEDGGLSSSSSIEYIPEEGGSGTVDQDVPQSNFCGYSAIDRSSGVLPSAVSARNPQKLVTTTFAESKYVDVGRASDDRDRGKQQGILQEKLSPLAARQIIAGLQKIDIQESSHFLKGSKYQQIATPRNGTSVKDDIQENVVKGDVRHKKGFNSLLNTDDNTKNIIKDVSRNSRGEPEQQKTAEIDDDTVICDLALAGACDGRECGRYHNKDSNLPYMWRVKMFGTWADLDQAETVERSFCAKKDKSEPVYVMGTPGFVTVIFCDHGNHVGVFQFDEQDDGVSIEAQRISTVSYSTADLTADSYLTQWRWFWKDNDGIWRLYEADTMQYTLETKYLAGQVQYQFARENFKNMIDFKVMTQTNLTTGKVGDVMRRPCVKHGGRTPELQSFPRIDVPLPQVWVPWDHTSPFELVKISTESTEYDDVAAKFFLTLSKHALKVDIIYRVQNHSQWGAFCRKEHDMKTKLQRAHAGASLDKRDLFHGTDSLDTALGICAHNFDQRVSGKHATVYGDGVYFATSSKHSHGYTKGPNRFLFLAHVLVGRFAEGKREYRRPPATPQSRLELYDSCVDKLVNPTMFILFDKSQHYPAYLIEYRDV